MLLGVWALISLLFGGDDEDEEGDGAEVSRFGSMKSVFKVGLVTIMNGGDNIGTYIPLFSQAKGAEIAVYVVVYYILMGVWCLAAYLVMKQRHVMRLAQKYAEYIVPFLYMGLGIYIVVKSDAYPWSIARIDAHISSHPGSLVMGVVTAGLLLLCIGGMGLFQWWKRKKDSSVVDETGDDGVESRSMDDGLSMSRAEVDETGEEQKATGQIPVPGDTQKTTGVIN